MFRIFNPAYFLLMSYNLFKNAAYSGHSSVRMRLSSTRGMYDVGIGCQWTKRFHCWTFLGGNKPARTSCKDIFVLSKSELRASMSFGLYRLPRNSSYLPRKIWPNLYSRLLPSCKNSINCQIPRKNRVSLILKIERIKKKYW